MPPETRGTLTPCSPNREQCTLIKAIQGEQPNSLYRLFDTDITLQALSASFEEASGILRLK